jgi:TBC1 domain family protein 5
MPENTYFRQPETQNMMLDILFIYTKLNPDVGYRQGMHELLAFVLWVVERDSIQTDESLLAMELILNFKYVEHDTFTLFTAIMRVAKSFYDPTGVVAPAGTDATESKKAESAMVIRSKRIFAILLPQYDPELAAHLVNLEIVPQIFLM